MDLEKNGKCNLEAKVRTKVMSNTFNPCLVSLIKFLYDMSGVTCWVEIAPSGNDGRSFSHFLQHGTNTFSVKWDGIQLIGVAALHSVYWQ